MTFDDILSTIMVLWHFTPHFESADVILRSSIVKESFTGD